MKQLKVLLFITLSLYFLTGCNTKEIPSSVEATILLDSAKPSTVIVKQNIDDNIAITLYLYDADDYYNPSEKKVISVNKELYKNNMTDALNYVFEETEIRINSTEFDKETKCLTVDIPQEVAVKFNSGSSNGIILTNELIDTILNLPDISSAVITVDGEKDTYADHYSFEGTFTIDEE